MEPSYFIITILGCADGGSGCTPAATVPTHYASEAACSAAAPEALVNNSDLDFPTLVAQCWPVAAQAAESGEHAQPTPAGAMRS